MLHVYQSDRTPDLGLSRRGFLQAGALGLAGLTLPSWLQGPVLAGPVRRSTAVIWIWLDGGPSHLDMYDPKPGAPADYRGAFGAISTSVPGIHINELLPRHAQVMDRLALVRSLHHDSCDHFAAAHWMLTGQYGSHADQLEPVGPSAGAVAAKLRGPNHPAMPAYMAVPIAASAGLVPGYHGGASLGTAFNPMDAHVPIATSGVDQPNPHLGQALDLAAEPPRLRERYGRHIWGQGCLLARRLVEAGVTFVTVHMGGWDDHANIEDALKYKLPIFDTAIATLVEDLVDRGLYDTVALCVCGEFGRTPRVNPAGGRDHWGQAMSVLLGGGGIPGGAIVGSTTAKGEYPKDRPLVPADLLATLYQVLGIDATAPITDQHGQAHPVLGDGAPIAELLSQGA